MIMKKIYAKAVMAAFIGMIAAAACTTDDNVTPPLDSETPFQIALTATAEGTRTTLNDNVLIKWNADDATKMGVIAKYSYDYYDPYDYGGSGTTMSGTKIYQSKSADVREDGKAAVFAFSETSADNTYMKNYKINSLQRAIYPYSSGYLTTNFTIANPQKQAEAGETIYGSTSVPMASDLLTEGTSEISTDGKKAAATIQMHILSSIIAFYVYDSEQTYKDESVKTIELQSTTGNVAGDTKITWTDYAAGGVPALTGSTARASVSLTSSFSLNGISSKEPSAPGYVALVPGEFSGKIVITTDKAKYFYSFTNKSFTRAEVKPMSINLSNAKAERLDLATYVKPVVTLTTLYRRLASASSSSVITKLDVKQGADKAAAAGFYIRAMAKGYGTDLKIEEVLAGDKYVYGDPNNNGDAFELLVDGTVRYTTTVSLGTGNSNNNISFAVIPFDQFGIYGDCYGANGYGKGGATASSSVERNISDEVNKITQ